MSDETLKSDETIEKTVHIHEEETAESAPGKDWTEEFKVAGSELVSMVKQLSREVGVRRIVIKSSTRNIHFELPMVVGVAGIVLLPAALTMVALVAALVTDCSILVERSEPVEKAPEVEEVEEVAVA